MIEKTRNIILISIDNLRFDCIGYQHDKRALKNYEIDTELKTPTLDSIADKSVCFNSVISTSTYTTASHASIITGLYPPRHGIRAFYDTKLSEEIFTLAELLRDKGYLTILSTDVLELWKPLDLNRGFTYIFERQDKELYKFLDVHRSENIFVFIHYYDIHEPYIFSEYEIFENYNSDYYAELDKLCKKYNIDLGQTKERPHTAWKKLSEHLKKDKKIFFPLFVKGVNKFDNGRFKELVAYLKNSGYMNNSLLVIFSDHGEGRCTDDVNIFSHAGKLYDDVIRVPLIIYDKNMEHEIIDTQISTVDIFPTILDISLNNDICIPYKIDGQSLLSIIDDDRKDHLAYSEVWTTGSGMYYLGDDNDGNPKILSSNNVTNWILNQRSIRSKGKKYIIYGMPDVLLDKNIFNISNEEFIKRLYRCVLGRIEDKEGFDYWLNIINKKEKDRLDIINYFFSSDECQNKKTFIVFDLEKDPEELNSIDSLKNPLYMIESFKYFDDIITMEMQSVNSKKIFESKNDKDRIDEEIVKKRLKDLGYF